MIDFHCHILPGVDDGAKNLEASLALLRQEKEAGVTRVYLTPHQNKNTHRVEELRQSFETLREAAKDIGIELLLGAEIYYYPGMVADLKAGKLLTMNNTKFVLVEFSFKTETDVSEAIYELKVAGYEPIVAHVERYTYLKKGDYFEIKDSGCYIQVNTSSLDHFSLSGPVKYLIKNGMVDFIGSDCHSPEKRPAKFEKLVKLIKKKRPDLEKALLEEDKITK